MRRVKIITDSCCSLSKEELEKMGVDCVELSFTLEGESYIASESPIKEPEQFYNKLAVVKKCSTSCANRQTFQDIFEKYVDLDYDVFYIGLSGGLSCTYENALVASNEINSDNSQRVWVADSLTGSYGIALLVEEAVKLASEGKSAKEIFEALDKNKFGTFAVFAPGDLQFLMRSGRIGKLAASVGTMLKLVPILSADENGKLKMVSKCIGRKKAISVIENSFLQNSDLNKAETIYIGHTNQKEEAEKIRDFIQQQAPNKTVKIGYIDYIMGCCCGPNTIAVFGTLK